MAERKNRYIPISAINRAVSTLGYTSSFVSPTDSDSLSDLWLAKKREKVTEAQMLGLLAIAVVHNGQRITVGDVKVRHTIVDIDGKKHRPRIRAQVNSHRYTVIDGVVYETGI